MKNKIILIIIIILGIISSIFIKIIFSATGCLLVIPITAYVTSFYLTKESK
jgi:uncharacterized membrane protein